MDNTPCIGINEEGGVYEYGCPFMKAKWFEVVLQLDTILSDYNPTEFVFWASLAKIKKRNGALQ